MGVSALGASLVKLLLESVPDAQVCFFIGRRSSAPYQLSLDGRLVEVEVLNDRLSPKAPLKEHLLWLLLMALLFSLLPFATLREKILKCTPCLNVLNQCGFIGDIRGGDSFSDIYGLRGLVLGSLPGIIVLLLGKRLVPRRLRPTVLTVPGWRGLPLVSS